MDGNLDYDLKISLKKCIHESFFRNAMCFITVTKFFLFYGVAFKVKKMCASSYKPVRWTSSQYKVGNGGLDVEETLLYVGALLIIEDYAIKEK